MNKRDIPTKHCTTIFQKRAFEKSVSADVRTEKDTMESEWILAMLTALPLVTGCAQMRSIETLDGDFNKVKANIKLYAKHDDELITIKNTMWQSNKGSVEFIVADTGEVCWGFSLASEKRKCSIRFRFGEVPLGYTQSFPPNGGKPSALMVDDVYVVSVPYVGMFNFWEAHGGEFVTLKRTAHGWQQVPRQRVHLQKWIEKTRSNNQMQNIGTYAPNSDL